MAQKASEEAAAVGTNLLDLVDRFEMSLRANPAHRIEDFLATCPTGQQDKVSPSHRSLLLALIQIDIGFRCRRKPADVNQCYSAEYLKRFSELQSVSPGASEVFEVEFDAKEGLPGFDALAFRAKHLKAAPGSVVGKDTAGGVSDTVRGPNAVQQAQSAGKTSKTDWSLLLPPKAADEIGDAA